MADVAMSQSHIEMYSNKVTAEEKKKTHVSAQL